MRTYSDIYAEISSSSGSYPSLDNALKMHNLAFKKWKQELRVEYSFFNDAAFDFLFEEAEKNCEKEGDTSVANLHVQFENLAEFSKQFILKAMKF